ncbi:platelet-activating factor acetylhydrolase [Holotrichia oblita]|uniref:Platelet-activating factor acetylhydrolase n=1 Tax=Holotrichia oblita TaxID=644536 RepID=A0ACB9TD87_HOLOL|nr:platelet-activating factor acetylhydrolase [Holotrichia oblita]
MPCSLRKLYDAMTDVPAESIVHSNQYHTWSSLLHLSPEEINERLQVYMFNLLKCEDKQAELGPFCAIYEYFPTSTQLDDTVLINRELGVQFQPIPRNLYEEYDESKFKWQENLEPSLFLQKFNRYRQLFKCMDYEYIPFLDSIMVRFHDKCDKFGISTETWTKNSFVFILFLQILRSRVRMHDFFRTVIFQDPYALLYAYKEMSRMLSKTEQAEAALIEIGGQDINLRESSMNIIRQQFSSCPFLRDCSVEGITDMSPSYIDPVSSIRVPQYLAEGFNLNRLQEVRGVSTIFRSLDGLKVTVEKTYLFDTKPSLKLKLETKHHEAVMHIQHHKKKRFTFQILSSSGARIIFAQPDTTISYNTDTVIKVKQPRYEKQRHYIIKEYETIGFGERLCLHVIHFLDEMSLLRILNQYLPLKHFSSTETLQLLDFKKSIVFKSTTSLTDIRWQNRIPKQYSKLIKAIKKIKRSTVPHFKIISTALHKYRYIKVVPLKITIHFADGPKVLKYIPNLDTKKKIEVTKCVPLASKNSFTHLRSSLPKNTYEWRLSLPNGLQIATEPSVEAGTRHIVQYYIPINQNMPEEVSRTFMYNGCIQIRYRDGTIKMIGVHGRCIIGELPCNSTGLKDKKVKIKATEPKIYWERGKIHRLMNLQKSIIRKIYRYQTKFVHIPMKNYSLNKHKRKETNHLTRSTNHLRPAIDFYISENSFQDYYTIDTATNDSHTSINDDGELTTIFADGTKITSWFIIEPEMIVIDMRDTEVWEIDPDDYTCNFLVPKIGGWMNVQLYHQCEHPQYATVVSYGKNSLRIRLPDIEYQVREDGTLFVNVNDELFSYVTYNNIKVQSNYCKTCYQCCETVINVRSLWSKEEEVKDEDILLETKDTFNKVFSVDYKGTCYRNDNYISG